MNKTKEAYKTIGEVAKELDVPAHVLRFWENKFDRLKLIKRKNDKNYKMTHTEIFQNIIYTWKKFVNGEKCKNIRIPENFVMELD